MLLAGMMFLSASGAAAQDISTDPITWSIAAKEKTVSSKPGGTFIVYLTAKIEAGWHLYSLDQPEGGPKPTRITVPSEQVFEQSGTIESPEPNRAHDENFGMETEFFKESVTFTLPLRVAEKAPAGQHKLQVQVRFQTCNDQLCLPPKTVKLELTVEVTGK
jgi:thiol:disulfide interchange protein DsbD